jgi:hypothetical protein
MSLLVLLIILVLHKMGHFTAEFDGHHQETRLNHPQEALDIQAHQVRAH